MIGKYPHAEQGRRAVADGSHGKRRLDEGAKRSAGRLPGVKKGVRAHVAVLAALVAIVIGSGTGSAVALLSVNATVPGETITSGDLKITVGDLAWKQATPGATPSPSTNPLNSSSPEGFVSMPGDVVEIRVPVTTYLQGDNLVADMVIDCADTVTDNAEISATFHIENANKERVAPDSGNVPTSEPLTVHGLLGSDAGTTQTWTVVIQVEVLGGYQWVTPTSPDLGISWTAGSVLATLNQVRPASSGPNGDGG